MATGRTGRETEDLDLTFDVPSHDSGAVVQKADELRVVSR
jgi:hypothetical protein